MGVNSACNTIGENVGAYNTVQAMLYQGSTVSVGVYGMVPGVVALTCVPFLTFSVCFLVLTEQASPIGWFQSALIAPVGEE